jgi:DNA adenine methylase
MSTAATVVELHGPRPFIKWVGGKRQLLHELHKHIPNKYGRYFEPFFGGGALYWSLQPENATIGDINQELTTTLKCIRNNVGELILHLSVFERLHISYNKDFFLDLRARSPVTAVAIAARFITLNRLGFNGLYRVNKSGGFNVPYGKWALTPKVCDGANLRACSAALKHTTILHGEFSEIVLSAKRGDFVYFDPPYWPVSKTANFTSYTTDGFSSEDQERLRDVAAKLKSRGVRVLLSNADVPQVRKLYKHGFEIRRVEARRSINNDSTKRGPVGELLIG